MRADGPRQRALQLFALCGFAVAQPLFDLTGRNPAFLFEHRLERWRLVAYAIGLIVLPALALVAIERVASVISDRLGRVVQTALVGGLGAMIVAPLVVRRASSAVAVLVLVVAGVAIGSVYRRTNRAWTWLAPAPVLFLFVFLLSSGPRQFLAPAPAAVRAEQPKVARSAVFVLFDEIALSSLLRPDGKIDGVRFPNVARLAAASTWYPRATANAGFSTAAVPSLLTGRYPTWSRGPGFAYYTRFPDNLLTVAARTHDVHAYEWASKLCPPSVCSEQRQLYRAWRQVFADSAFLLAQRVLPRAADSWLPPIGARWGGFLAESHSIERRVKRLPGPLRPAVRALTKPFSQPRRDRDRIETIETQFASLGAPERPTLWFFDVIFPHFPWERIADLRAYPDPKVEGWRWPAEDRWTNDTALMANQMQRYMLQLRAWDTLLGRLLDRLEASGLWDDALVIVTADQGLSLQPGQPRRTVVPQNAADIMPVPLFIRYPGQRSAAIDPRNAELVDLTPTIADLLGLDIPYRVDGTSLRGPDQHRTKKLSYSLDGTSLSFPPDLGTGSMAATIDELFGEGGGPDDLYGVGPARDLLGRDVASLKVSAPAAGVDAPTAIPGVDPAAPVLPIAVKGSVDRGASDVAVAVNGTIAGVGRVYGGGRFVVILSPRHLVAGTNRLSYVVVGNDGGLHAAQASSGSTGPAR